MKKNIGGVDRILRLLVGVAIGAYGVYTQNWLGLIALVPIGTALAGTCLLYIPLGLSTCAHDETKA